MRIRPVSWPSGWPLLLFLALGCAPGRQQHRHRADDPTPTESTLGVGRRPTRRPAPPTPSVAAGTLTIGTDSPAYDPWFSKNDPTNGEGFESAVAYAVAEKLGFTGDAVQWTKVPFNSSYAPGAKKFDFDINQISITPAARRGRGLLRRLLPAAQAVIVLKGSRRRRTSPASPSSRTCGSAPRPAPRR